MYNPQPTNGVGFTACQSNKVVIAKMTDNNMVMGRQDIDNFNENYRETSDTPSALHEALFKYVMFLPLFIWRFRCSVLLLGLDTMFLLALGGNSLEQGELKFVFTKTCRVNISCLKAIRP